MGRRSRIRGKRSSRSKAESSLRQRTIGPQRFNVCANINKDDNRHINANEDDLPRYVGNGMVNGVNFDNSMFKKRKDDLVETRDNEPIRVRQTAGSGGTDNGIKETLDLLESEVMVGVMVCLVSVERRCCGNWLEEIGVSTNSKLIGSDLQSMAGNVNNGLDNSESLLSLTLCNEFSQDIPSSQEFAASYQQAGGSASSSVSSKLKDKKWKCLNCDKKYHSEKLLRNHVESKHPQVETGSQEEVFRPGHASTMALVGSQEKDDKKAKGSSESDLNMDLLNDSTPGQTLSGTQNIDASLLRVVDEATNKHLNLSTNSGLDGDPDESINRDKDGQINALDDEVKYIKAALNNLNSKLADSEAEVVQWKNFHEEKERQRQNEALKNFELEKELKEYRGGARRKESSTVNTLNSIGIHKNNEFMPPQNEFMPPCT